MHYLKEQICITTRQLHILKSFNYPKLKGTTETHPNLPLSTISHSLAKGKKHRHTVARRESNRCIRSARVASFSSRPLDFPLGVVAHPLYILEAPSVLVHIYSLPGRGERETIHPHTHTCLRGLNRLSPTRYTRGTPWHLVVRGIET